MIGDYRLGYASSQHEKNLRLIFQLKPCELWNGGVPPFHSCSTGSQYATFKRLKVHTVMIAWELRVSWMGSRCPELPVMLWRHPRSRHIRCAFKILNHGFLKENHLGLVEDSYHSIPMFNYQRFGIHGWRVWMPWPISVFFSTVFFWRQQARNVKPWRSLGYPKTCNWQKKMMISVNFTWDIFTGWCMGYESFSTAIPEMLLHVITLDVLL